MFGTLASVPDEVIPIVAITGGIALGMLGVIGGFIKQVLNTRAREQSRREIAAYIAEGSMSAEEGAKLMEAGTPLWDRIKRS